MAQAEGSLFLKLLMCRRKVNNERKTSLERTGSNPPEAARASHKMTAPEPCVRGLGWNAAP